MNLNYFFKHIIIINLNPVVAWETIVNEPFNINKTKYSYLIPLIIIVSLATFTGSLIFANAGQSIIYSVLNGVKVFGLIYLTAYSSAFVLQEITYPLDLGRDFSISFLLVIYSLTPFLLCQIISRIFDSLLFINILGMYGLYIFWTGIEQLLKPPKYKKVPLLIATFLSIIGIYVISNMILTMVANRIYYSFFA